MAEQEHQRERGLLKRQQKTKGCVEPMIAYVLKVHGLSKKKTSHASSSDAKDGIKSQYPTIVLYWVLRSMTVSFRKSFLIKSIKY